MNIILLALVAVYLACAAWLGYASVARLKKRNIGEPERVHRYRFSIIWNTLSAVLVFVAVALTPITLGDVGFRGVALSLGTGFAKVLLIGVLVICGALTALFIYQIVAFLRSQAYRDSVAASLKAKSESASLYDRVVDNLIPRTKREKLWFGLTSLTAGFCEELVFRGFLFYLLAAVFPALPSILIAALVGLFFGLAHFYQGAKGVVKTALLGALFGLLYIATDSILPCVILHFLFDVSSAFLYESEE